MATNSIHSSTDLYRRLTWQSTVPISIRLAPSSTSPNAPAAITDTYFIQAPRHTYLPLLIPEIKQNMVELALGDEDVAKYDVKDWWFEEEEEVGGEGVRSFAGQGACRWHWSIDLIATHSYMSRPRSLPLVAQASLPPASPPILRLILHLSKPPADKLLMPNDLATCKSQWLNQVKEADFVRWRNTSRVTNLRKVDLEAGWDGIVLGEYGSLSKGEADGSADDFESFSKMASKIVPLPIPAPTNQQQPSRPPSTDPSGRTTATESTYATRSVPIKLYLPDNAPAIQDVLSPMDENGKPNTLISVLHKLIPLLFPVPPSSFKDPYPLAFPIAQGIVLPPEADIAWVASCVCGADGWVRLGICLRAA
ncbi:hypothetical protein L202_02587 [Cryptococcus amylolentus CBS 6039]|uniref:Autophagy protein 5 n=1 Tax=Cryptococcus amylolentus CBS 6039 TaxID=1295533 RepID=A0A1E3I1A9_9TREE|nr:hypothetical protein L202_02587 [Cryptococcus amylolentus CBS 6039]ODN82308.1 hypothetical protein L202_02587 [Cryptococcus amylolentus CBS 6039]